MPTRPDLAITRARRAWWLKVSRDTDPRKPTLAEVAEAAGLSKGSGSVASLWETNQAAPKLEQLERLAGFYGVPLTVFTEPPETDQERLVRYRQLALGALEQEQRDWDGAGEPARDVEDAPVERRRRRSA